MIKIDFDNKTQILTVKGHAFYHSDNDIVCAGVSSVVLGAAHYWQNHNNICVAQKESGWIQITFHNDCLFVDNNLRAQFELMWKQLSILAANYCKYLIIENKPNWIFD